MKKVVSIQRIKSDLPFMLVAALLPLVLFSAMAWFDDHLQVARAQDHVRATTDALAEHAQKVVETADLVLQRVLDRVADKDWGTIANAKDVHDFLAAMKQQLPQIESAFLVSPAGINVASSRRFPLPDISDAGREYFVRALEGEQDLFISEAFQGQIDGTYAFTITRARLRDGRFDGLAGVTISSAYFEAFYRAVSIHPDASSAALIRTDGKLLVRFPEIASRPARVPADSPVMRAIGSGGDTGVFSGLSAIGGHDQLGAFRRLKHVPLVVDFAQDRSVYLHDWYIHLVFFAALALFSCAAVIVAGRAMLRDAAHKQDALRQLVEETNRRQAAEQALQQAQKMEALGRLTGGVAHDFNNLLAAILGSLELVQRSVTEPRPVRLLATARRAAERGAHITAHMLAFSRHQEVAPRPVDLGAAIGGMDDLLRATAGAMIRVRYDLAHHAWWAVADPAQFEVALLNLAANARDAMPRGGELTVSTAALTLGSGSGGPPGLSSGEYVRVSVSDTGEGMSDDVRARALEPFFTTKGPSKGTGLGLSMVFGFASLVGGTVTLESTQGLGTTVSLYLPRAAAASVGPPGRAPGADSRPVRADVLLVDDDETVRMTTRAMLEDLGHTVVEADSARRALAILRSGQTFTLLVIDFAMPETNGSALAAEIRKSWPHAAILFVTGYVENDELRPWAERGVPTLNKPFSRAGLANAVAAAVERSPASRRVIPFRR